MQNDILYRVFHRTSCLKNVRSTCTPVYALLAKNCGERFGKSLKITKNTEIWRNYRIPLANSPKRCYNKFNAVKYSEFDVRS